ncbi:mechanosensitive ion channel family protein [Pararhodospirillum photometricum]|nr:mechanosensitive ion channel family protein [Pararhodospirillum photometricum]
MSSSTPRCLLSRLVLGIVMVLALAPGSARAVDPLPTAPAAPAAPVVRDALGRETPEGMVRGLLKAMAEEDYGRAAAYLDVPTRRAARKGLSGPDLALALQRILDKGGFLEPASRLSTAPEGRLDDGLDPNLERFATVRTADGPVDLLAQRLPGPDDTLIWLVSSTTVTQLPALTDQVASGLLERLLPSGLDEGPRFRGVPLTHWGALLGLAVVAYLASSLLTALIRLGAAVALRREEQGLYRRLIEAALAPFRVCLAVWAFALGGLYLGVSVVARQTLGALAEMVGWIGLAWFLWRIVDAFSAASLDRMSRQGKTGALAAVRFFQRTGKVVILAGAVIVVMDTSGFDVSAGLAALGIGGLAVALGAQKTIENLVGSLMLIADRPIREGDFCKVGTTLGTVEDIGLRSTRIRTLARTVVSIPNGELAAVSIENYSRRDMFWFHPILSLRLDTTPDQIRYLLVTLRELLYAHPRVDPTPARVRFRGVSRDCVDLEMFAYVRAEDYADFLEVQEDLTLQVMDVVAASGAAFALPGQTLHLGRDTPTDPGLRETAEAQVRAWREAGSLPLPRFPDERIAELKGSIPYPPPGSVHHQPVEPAADPPVVEGETPAVAVASAWMWRPWRKGS